MNSVYSNGKISKFDYFVWKKRLASAEAKCDFFIRLRETLNKYDGILTGLASSMRCELRALSIMDRAEARSSNNNVSNSEKSSTSGHKVR
jgi:hypothetical protein